MLAGTSDLGDGVREVALAASLLVKAWPPLHMQASRARGERWPLGLVRSFRELEWPRARPHRHVHRRRSEDGVRLVGAAKATVSNKRKKSGSPRSTKNGGRHLAALAKTVERRFAEGAAAGFDAGVPKGSPGKTSADITHP